MEVQTTKSHPHIFLSNFLTFSSPYIALSNHILAPITSSNTSHFSFSFPFLFSKPFPNQKAKMSVKSFVASIGKGYHFHKKHSFLSATIREIFACWEYPKPTPNWNLLSIYFLMVFHFLFSIIY